MAVDYDKMIHYFRENDEVLHYEYLSELPDTCPICNHAISPTYILLYNKSFDSCELLCGCPRNQCGSLFFVEYRESSFQKKYLIVRLHPSKYKKDFPNEITDLSPNFIKIYNQSLHAEQEGLDMICGVGYRKALEYLIKDYIISENPEQEETVKNIPSIQRCINQYIDDANIKEMAQRATWLGNDETHYVRKWEDKDIKDLKNLIDLTVFFISMKIKAKKYKEEMLAGK